MLRYCNVSVVMLQVFICCLLHLFFPFVEVWLHHFADSSREIQFKLAVLDGQHHHISPMSLSTCLILGPGDAFDLLPHCRWMSVVHGCPPSVIGSSLLLLPVLGTVCPNMSRAHPLCLFSEVASRLSSSGVPSHDFHCNFCSAYAATDYHFQTLASFLLL